MWGWVVPWRGQPGEDTVHAATRCFLWLEMARQRQPFWEAHVSSPVASVAVSLETTRSYCVGNGLEDPVERQGTECSWSLVHRVGGIL